MRQAEAFLRRRPLLVAALVLGIGVAALLSSALFSGRVLAAEDVLLFQSPFGPALAPPHPPSNQFLYDTFYQLHPDMLFVRAALRSWHLPGWNPYVGGGEAILASQQHAMFTPFNWLLTIAPFWQSLEWVAAIKLLVGGLGLYLLLTALGLRRTAALLGASAFMLSAPLIDWLSHPHVNVYVVLPWLLLACERLLRTAAWRDALWVALAVAFVVLGGHPPSMVIVASVALPWLVYRMAVNGASVRMLVRLVAGTVLGVGIGAIVELPLIELAHQSYQISRSQGGGPKSMLFGFFAPELWGRPDKFEIGGGPYNYIERTGYFGVLPLLFAAIGFVRRPRGPQVFFAVVGLIALSLAVKLPVLTSLFSDLPEIDQINRFRYLVVCSFSGAVLAAYGVDALLSLPSRRRALVALAVALLIAVVPLGWVVQHHDVLSSWGIAVKHILGIGHQALLRPQLQLAVFMRWALFAAIGVVLVAVAAWRPRWTATLAAVAVAVTLFDLVAYQRGFQPAIPLAEAKPATPPALTLLQQRAGHGRIAGQVEFGPNVAERYRLRDARIYRSPPLERRGKLWAALGGAGTDQETMTSAAQPIVDAYAVDYELSYELQLDKTGHWQTLPVAPVVRNKKPLPRAWLAYGWRAARGADDAAAKVASNPAAIRRNPVIEGIPARLGATAPGAARFTADQDEHVALRVNAARPAELILADTYYPGWKAKVDGHAATIHPADVDFRAVAVPAGRHAVTFDYESTSIRVGWIVSLISTLILIAGFALTGARRQRRRTGARTHRGEPPATTAPPESGDR